MVLPFLVHVSTRDPHSFRIRPILDSTPWRSFVVSVQVPHFYYEVAQVSTSKLRETLQIRYRIKDPPFQSYWGA